MDRDFTCCVTYARMLLEGTKRHIFWADDGRQATRAVDNFACDLYLYIWHTTSDDGSTFETPKSVSYGPSKDSWVVRVDSIRPLAVSSGEWHLFYRMETRPRCDSSLGLQHELVVFSGDL
jgi:hypothetical protein